MAENELLDVSNPFIYKRWRRLIDSGQFDPTDAASALCEDFSSALRMAMRKEPLSLVFVACGEDKEALHAAVALCKDRSLARHVEHACEITQSRDVSLVAKVLTDLLINGLIDQCNRQAVSIHEFSTIHRQVLIEAATRERLEIARANIVTWLSSALEGDISNVPPPSKSRRPTTEEVLNISLVSAPNRVSRRRQHV